MKTTVKNLLNSNIFVGNGKYYTKYKDGSNTVFGSFKTYNSNFFKVVDKGNDAVRKGVSGEFLIVEFTPEFLEIVRKYQEEIKALEIEKANAEASTRQQIEKASKLIDKVEGESFGNTCKRLGDALNGDFLEKTVFYGAVKEIRK